MGAGPPGHVLHGGLHLPLRPGRAEDPRRAHARGLPDHRRRPAVAARSTRWASAAGRTRCGWSSTPPPGRPWSSALADLGDRFRLVLNEVEVVAPDEPLPNLPVARAVWKPAPDLSHVGRVLADRRRPAPHRAEPARCRPRPSATSPTCCTPSCWSSTQDTNPCRFADEIRWNQAYYRLARGLPGPDRAHATDPHHQKKETR